MSEKYVTNAELKDAVNELEKKVPSRWEVRFLILAGMAAAQVVPAGDAAQAAINLIT